MLQGVSIDIPTATVLLLHQVSKYTTNNSVIVFLHAPGGSVDMDTATGLLLHLVSKYTINNSIIVFLHAPGGFH